MAMYQGNWKCSKCGGEITELPFQPRSENGLTCRSCFAKSRNNDNAPAPETASTSTPPPDDAPHFADTELASEPPADDPFAGMDTSGPATAGEKPKFTGDWACAICGATIATLPFNPSRTDNLKCLECFKEGKS